MTSRTNSRKRRTPRPAGIKVGSRLLALLILALALAVCGGTVQAEEEDFDYEAQTLRVGVWMDGKQDGDVLQKGEKFGVGFQTNQDAYAVVYHIDSEGFVSVLWPRSRYDDGFIFGGHEYDLPVSGARRLVASGETGEGFVEAIVSAYPFDLRELELDFHHEYTDEPWNFQVAGDPFLAMNEVNYVITGLEDSGDYVVTNYLTYYVHQKVDHPRYLCNQCHFQDDVAYHPYNDECTLEITYDYGWNNRWYDTYDYYPVYHNPVYVYVDPWTWRPWVNFWYNPWYRCAPSWGWGWSYTCYTWYDSPYWWGDSYAYYNGGHRRWRPLDRNYASDVARTKVREYSRVSGLIAQTGPGDSVRSAMKTRTPVADGRRGGGGAIAVRTGDGRLPSVDRVTRDRTRIETSTRVRGDASGLQIRDNSRVRIDGRTGRTPLRHTAGGGAEKPALKPTSRTGSRTDSRSATGTTRVRAQRPESSSRSGDKPAASRVRPDKPASGGDRAIKPVEPRKRGTRIWNARPGTSSPDRSTRTPSVNSRSGRSDNPSRSSVRRAPSRSSSGSSADRSGGSSVRQTPRRDSGSSAKPATPKVRSRNSGSKSSATKSSGGSRSSGGSKSRNSGSSRGGSSQRR